MPDKPLSPPSSVPPSTLSSLPQSPPSPPAGGPPPPPTPPPKPFTPVSTLPPQPAPISISTPPPSSPSETGASSSAPPLVEAPPLPPSPPTGEPPGGPTDGSPSTSTIPQEEPKLGGSNNAQASDIKRSPFRFLPLILLALLLIGGGIFAATKLLGNQAVKPTTTPKKTTKQVTLTYWGLWETSSSLQTVFNDFSAQNPGVTINYVQQSPQDYRERLQAALDKGEGPDLFRFHNSWVPMLKKHLDSLPSSVMTTTDYNQIFYPVAQTDLKSSSSYFGIPLMIDGLGLYYNQEILSKAGKNPPTTWQEARTLATELTITDESGQIQQAGIALGTTTNVDHWSDIIGLMLLQNGADPAKPNSQLAQDAIAFYQLFLADGIWDKTLPNSTYAFAIGKVAMILAPSWRAHEITNINPDIKFTIAPVPQLPNTKVAWASYWVEGVSSQSKNKDLAWQLLKYLSEKETLRKFYTSASQERLFGEPFSRTDLADQLAGDPYTAAYVSTAPYAESWYLCSRTFDSGINEQVIKYYEDALNAIESGTAPAKALEVTQKGITQVLSRYGTGSTSTSR
jgi:multiple sugar transport system substrate-binding protein